jgi:hypothetical protein
MEVRISSLLALLLAALLGGCSVGEYGTSNTTTGTDASMSSGGPEATFDSMVKPRVGTCLSCHSGGQNPNLSTYALLQPKYKTKPGNTNILVTKGDHQGITYLNATDKAAVESWINSL